MSGWHILMRAHDHVWKDRRVPLAERVDACALIRILMANAAFDEWFQRVAVETFGIR